MTSSSGRSALLPTLDVDIPGIPGAVMVDTGRHHTELALSPPSYTAVRAWHESSPPGFNVNVA